MMKKILVVVFILLSVNAKAQFTKNNSLYFDAGISIGNYLGGGFHLNYIYKKKTSLQIGFFDLTRKASSRPKDYTGGVISVLSFGKKNPKDKLKSVSFLIGKVLPYNRGKKTKWNLRAGITYSEYKEPINYTKVDPGIFGMNYTFEYEKSNAIGVIVKPELEIAFSENFGAGLAAIASYNDKTFVFGLEFVVKFGFLR